LESVVASKSLDLQPPRRHRRREDKAVDQLAKLLQQAKPITSLHISNVFSEGELGSVQTVAKSAIVQLEAAIDDLGQN
jgi:hypothetical protein